MRIILTNWVNILGVFLTVFCFTLFENMLDESLSYNLLPSAFSALILVCLYGMMFWAYFLLSLIILDLLLIAKRKNLITMLLVEWLIIAAPFTYGILIYKQWIFLVAIIAFLITQLMRKRLIVKIIL